MNNLDKLAYPHVPNGPFDHLGFTKRESACIQLGIPESGDPDLDLLIRKSNRQKAAVKAMQGILANSHVVATPVIASETAVLFAQSLFTELEKTTEKP
jgi:hypothetical protein